MDVINTTLRLFQRTWLSFRHSAGSSRKIQYILGLAVILLVGLVSFYHDESYQITTDSIQSLNDKINTLTTKIDKWNERAHERIEDQGQSTATTSPWDSSELTETSDIEALQPTHILGTGDHDLWQTKINKSPKGVVIIFGRNNDLFRLQETLRSIEERFNRVYQYDILIVSDSIHTDNFRKGVSAMTSSTLKFHHVPKSLFQLPKDLDKSKVKENRKNLRKVNINYTRAHRMKHTQRFWAKEIFNIELLQEYDYFIKVKPGTVFYCDVTFDLVQFMNDNQKTLGFSLALQQNTQGFPTLWDSVLKYIEQTPEDISEDPFIDFISDDKGLSFNGCQFRTSFEIGKLSFFRGEKYQKFAAYLDALYGIYYEAWDDSTFHTLGVSLLEGRHAVQFINHLGYDEFDPTQQGPAHRACPIQQDIRLKTKCTCNPVKDATWNEDSCLIRYYEINNVEVPDYVPDFKALKRKAREEKEKQDAQRKYEDEELKKEKELERKEKQEIAADLQKSAPEVVQQEGEEILPDDDLL